MSENSSSSSSGGIGFCGLLAVAFIVLKLTHYIDWSWWWVLAPLWGSIAVALGMVAIVFVVALISGLANVNKSARR